MTKIQKEAKRNEYLQKILSAAMRESLSSGLLGTTKLSTVFDSLEYLDFLMRLQKQIGPVNNDAAANAETFNDLAGAYASAG